VKLNGEDGGWTYIARLPDDFDDEIVRLVRRLSNCYAHRNATGQLPWRSEIEATHRQFGCSVEWRRMEGDMQMGFAPRRESADPAAAWPIDRHEDIITDRFCLRDYGGYLIKFDTASGQTWRLSDGYRGQWVAIEHEPLVGDVGEDSGD
jgi:hypothetical protein